MKLPAVWLSDRDYSPKTVIHVLGNSFLERAFQMSRLSRRNFLLTGLAVPAIVTAHSVAAQSAPANGRQELAVRNTQSFVVHDWRDHFSTLRKGAILCDSPSRVLHFWAEDGQHRIWPCSVPISDDLQRTGYTEITLKRRNPVWVPTPSMRERNPSLPQRVEAGPENPLGTRALNLTWQYYRIHGTHLETKIGRRASDGCYGLFNPHIEALFDLVQVGTQVRVI